MSNFKEMVQQLDAAYRQWTGTGLPTPAFASEDERLEWLHARAPYALLAHGTQADPVFYYANEQALDSFKYPREQFIGMPSRFSASPLDRAMRQTLLEQVTANGIAHGYSGYRVDREGHAFMIHEGKVWTLLDHNGEHQGQAALFWPDAERIGRLE
ncbi:MEKHLA domain-containing protein [Pseudomonas sp. REP124]|uniref:MEKHLA domain-containing protein n=1 Tax=Pseudomonas sp. REP124 TaxID=2875731 RepID=UPI001CCC6F03|nr:MEKHLA domain-containing protein [Pseudomonas sp. REP124]MBZ9781851.1 MEKHLA domain-containing protein [Pseudomonas sp. REP124]